MKTKYFVIMLTIVVGIVGVFLLTLMPYHFYQTTLSEGVKSEYLNLQKPLPSMIKGREFTVKEEDDGAFRN